MRKSHKITIIAVSAAIVASGALYLTQNSPSVPSETQKPTLDTSQPAIPAKKAGPDYIYPIVSGVPYPDTTDNISGTICNKSWSTKSIRPPVSVTNKIKVKALADYNSKFGTNYQMKDGELDHLISLEIGGAPADPNNLWFEPYTTQVNGAQVGAHEKDSVENQLHKEVCSTEVENVISIQKAQEIITSDWYACYLTIKNGNDCQ